VIPDELQYVEVIAVTASTGNDANTAINSQGSDEKRELPSSVTLLVRSEQAKILAFLEADGKLHLALVCRGMSENAAFFLQTQDEVIDMIYYPSEGDSDIETDPQHPHLNGGE